MFYGNQPESTAWSPSKKFDKARIGIMDDTYSTTSMLLLRGNCKQNESHHVLKRLPRKPSPSLGTRTRELDIKSKQQHIQPIRHRGSQSSPSASQARLGNKKPTSDNVEQCGDPGEPNKTLEEAIGKKAGSHEPSIKPGFVCNLGFLA
nr:hypothetical protein Iba_scaffold86742CG0010 [Ipomoea batatas]